MAEQSKGISLVLSGGGARGFAHVGVIKVLLEAGVPIAEVAGTSMGGIVGAYYATHGDVDALEKFARGLNRRSMLLYFDPCLPRYSLIKGDRFRRTLKEWFGDRTIEDAKIPLSITATRLTTQQSVILRRGPLVQALAASAAIPGLMPAVKIGEDYYVDGGITNNLPDHALHGLGPKVAVALPLLPQKANSLEHQPRIADVLTMVYAINRQHADTAARGALVIFPSTGNVSDTLGFHRSAEFVAAGEKAARAALPEILALLEA